MSRLFEVPSPEVPDGEVSFRAPALIRSAFAYRAPMQMMADPGAALTDGTVQTRRAALGSVSGTIEWRKRSKQVTNRLRTHAPCSFYNNSAELMHLLSSTMKFPSGSEGYQQQKFCPTALRHCISTLSRYLAVLCHARYLQHLEEAVKCPAVVFATESTLVDHRSSKLGRRSNLPVECECSLSLARPTPTAA